MSKPIVFVSHFRIKAGKLDAFKELSQDVAKQLGAEKPRTLAFLNYLDADGTRATFVHVFADAESMDRHFEGAGDRSEAAYQFLEPDGWEIYGSPAVPVIETMRQAAATSRVPVDIQPNYLGGFLRATSG